MDNTKADARPLFTVIIPAYNAEKTLARTIDAVFAQSFQSFEIIVIDDASTDSTVALVQERYGGLVRVIQKVYNFGSSVARNAGMDAAKGKYLAFVDADDIWHKDKLLLASTILNSHPAIGLFYHPYTQDDLSNKQLPDDITVYKLPFVKLLPANLIATSCAIIKNDPAYRFESSMRYTEDYDLWLRMGYKYGLYFVNVPLTQIFRPFTSKGGISENKWKMRKGEMRAYTRLAGVNPLFIIVLPFLLLSSIGKHIYKMAVGPQ